MQHNSTYEDDLDHMDSIDALSGALSTMTTLNDALYNAIVTMEIDRDRLEQTALESFSVMTEFADMLVRKEKIAYRSAHHVASRLVDLCTRQSLTVRQVTKEMIADVFKEVIGRSLTADSECIRRSLDAHYFVEVRTMPGGPAREPLLHMLSASERTLKESCAWLDARRQAIADSASELENRFQNL